ncbi:DNA translocase FtsK 4TM domain-containing protein, partial [Arcobacter aquimarinus]
MFSDFSHKYFGYLSYVYLLLLIIPLYTINFKRNIDKKDLILNILVVFLLFFVSLIFQALILENPYTRGEIGNILIDSLSPVIGRAGLYIFVLVGFIISFLVLFENSDFDIEDLKKIKNKIKLRKTLNIKQIENKQREKR